MVSETRLKIMSAIRSRHTKPELLVRKALHARGYRYRLHDKKLPGSPDITLPKFKAVILVNGCFWHGHNCHLFNPERQLTQSWADKIRSNKIRDRSNLLLYQKLGWKTLVVWECALTGKTKLDRQEWLHTIESWLIYDKQNSEIYGRNQY